MIHFDDNGRMRCDRCASTIAMVLPISVTTLAILGDAFTAEHEDCVIFTRNAVVGRTPLDVLIEHGSRCLSDDAWRTDEEFHDFLRAIAEVAKAGMVPIGDGGSD